jgi:hypothetical protein
MGPARVKYYGLFWITRPTYIVLQSIALVLCLVLITVGLVGILWTGIVLPHWPTWEDEGELIGAWLALTFWLGLLALIAESFEMYAMLRKFARAEAEQQAKLAIPDASSPAPTAPRTTGIQLPPDEPPNTNIQP